VMMAPPSPKHTHRAPHKFNFNKACQERLSRSKACGPDTAYAAYRMMGGLQHWMLKGRQTVVGVSSKALYVLHSNSEALRGPRYHAAAALGKHCLGTVSPADSTSPHLPRCAIVC